MVKKEVTAQVPEKKDVEGKVIQVAIPPCTIFVDYGETGEESIELFGQEQVNSNAFSNWRVTLQGGIRAALKSGLTPEQVQERLGSAKMGVAQSGGRVDPQTAFIAKFKMSTPEDQADMIKQLKEAAKG